MISQNHPSIPSFERRGGSYHPRVPPSKGGGAPTTLKSLLRKERRLPLAFLLEKLTMKYIGRNLVCTHLAIGGVYEGVCREKPRSLPPREVRGIKSNWLFLKPLNRSLCVTATEKRECGDTAPATIGRLPRTTRVTHGTRICRRVT